MEDVSTLKTALKSVLISPWTTTYHPTKYHAEPFVNILVVLITGTQRNRSTNITFPVGRSNNTKKLSCLPVTEK